MKIIKKHIFGKRMWFLHRQHHLIFGQYMIRRWEYRFTTTIASIICIITGYEIGLVQNGGKFAKRIECDRSGPTTT
jgi:hypothetical protein